MGCLVLFKDNVLTKLMVAANITEDSQLLHALPSEGCSRNNTLVLYLLLHCRLTTSD
jgi:hypothetical protein